MSFNPAVVADCSLFPRTEANVELDAILSAHVDDVIRSGEVRQRKLFRYRDSTMSAFEQMVDIHTPLQDAMKLALSQKITGAQQWSQDGNDVSQAMCQLREKAKGIIVKMINESGKSEGKKKTSPDQHEWADRAKKSRKAVHRLLKAIPIPRDAD